MNRARKDKSREKGVAKLGKADLNDLARVLYGATNLSFISFTPNRKNKYRGFWSLVTELNNFICQNSTNRSPMICPAPPRRSSLFYAVLLYHFS